MSKIQSVHDLYGTTTLTNLKRMVTKGRIPTAAELAAVLEANSKKPLPPWFVALVAKSLRGKLHKKKGRPKKDGISATASLEVAKAEYPRYLAWLQKRKRGCGLDGWSAIRGTHWWAGPPHQRAARIVTARWLNHMGWRAFLNKISS